VAGLLPVVALCAVQAARSVCGQLPRPPPLRDIAQGSGTPGVCDIPSVVALFIVLLTAVLSCAVLCIQSDASPYTLVFMMLIHAMPALVAAATHPSPWVAAGVLCRGVSCGVLRCL
jgi:hypothetical protein